MPVIYLKGPKEKEEVYMSNGSSKVTTDHNEIKSWAEERDAKPCRVKGTGGENDVGLLRLNFPGYAEENLEDISWEEFFEKFEENELALVYQEETSNGEFSNFSKIVSRETVQN